MLTDFHPGPSPASVLASGLPQSIGELPSWFLLLPCPLPPHSLSYQKSQHLYFSFLEILLLWRNIYNNGCPDFIYVFCKHELSALSHVFLREGPQSVCGPSGAHSQGPFRRQHEGPPIPCSLL